MADLENIAAMKANLVQVSIGADNAPLSAEVDVSGDPHTLKAIQAARYGLTNIGFLVLGAGADLVIKVKFIQLDGTFLKRMHAIPGASDNLSPGAQLTPETLRIHDPQMVADVTKDLLFHAVVPTKPGQKFKGDDFAGVEVEFRCQRNSANGKVWSIGV